MTHAELMLANATSSTAFIQIALIVFVAVFVVIVTRALVARREHIDHVARIPLDEERRSEPSPIDRRTVAEEAVE